MPGTGERCEFPKFNAGDAEIGELLGAARVVAVVGLSPNPERPSYRVAEYLQDHGYRIIPVNPAEAEILGEKSYPSLLEVPGSLDVVDIFRKTDAVPEIVEAAIAKRAKAVWMQEGVVHNAAAERARAAGLKVVMNKCMLKEHAARAAKS